MSIVEKDEREVIIKNMRNASCKRLQNHEHKNWTFWWSYVNTLSLSWKAWNDMLDGGSNVNNILESLRKKLGLKRPQLAPFVIMMVDKWKV